MNEKLEGLKLQAVIIFTIQVLVALLLEFGFRVRYASFILVFVGIDILFVAYLMYSYSKEETNRSNSIKKIVSANLAQAIQYGDIGMVIYDQNYIITWMSDLFAEREIDYVGEKLTVWLPDINLLFQEGVDNVTVDFEGYRYLIERKDEEQVLFFKDITDISLLELNYHNEQVVVGLIHMDNYNDTIQYEDEQKIASINANLRQKVIDWCLKHNMLVKRVRADRFLVVFNEEDYRDVVQEKFSILNDIRMESQNIDVTITLSMAFARGTADFLELDKMVNDLLELAQNRGGDQVAARKYGEDVHFIGGSSEAQEKRSRVRVRVMSQTINNMIESSSQVFIVGHKEMDFDCAGAALGMSRIVAMVGKECYVIMNNIAIEKKLEQALYANNIDLMSNHNFISQQQALELLDDDSLVIAVDHHSLGLSCAEMVIESCENIMVIDHHRRKSSDNINATLVYVEPSASSTTELVVEFLQYQNEKVDLLEVEANMMFAGMLVDTNHFRSRSGSRTFEAAATLRKMGADPIIADDMLKDSYHEFELITNILSYSRSVEGEFIVTPIDDSNIYDRATLSKAADYLLSIQDVKAAFVIANISKDEVAISARGNGEVNVQTIMEQMHGGGHFTAAALQRKNTSVQEITIELESVIKSLIDEEREPNESNFAE